MNIKKVMQPPKALMLEIQCIIIGFVGFSKRSLFPMLVYQKLNYEDKCFVSTNCHHLFQNFTTGTFYK